LEGWEEVERAVEVWEEAVWEEASAAAAMAAAERAEVDSEAAEAETAEAEAEVDLLGAAEGREAGSRIECNLVANRKTYSTGLRVSSKFSVVHLSPWKTTRRKCSQSSSTRSRIWVRPELANSALIASRFRIPLEAVVEKEAAELEKG
jgi:hypothetical protein